MPVPARLVGTVLGVLLLGASAATPPAPAPARPVSVWSHRSPEDGTCMALKAPVPVDPGLCAAARAVARTLSGGSEVPQALLSRLVRFHVGGAGVPDPDVRSVVLRGSDRALTHSGLMDVLQRPDGATHVGAALAEGPEGTVGVALFVVRRLTLTAPFPRVLPAPATVPVRARLARAIAVREALVMQPDGAVLPVPFSRNGERVRVDVPAGREGVHTLQLVIDAGRGPEVGILAQVYVATPPPTEPPPIVGADGHRPDAQAFEALRDLRSKDGLGVRRDAALDRIAQTRAEEIARTGQVIHRPPSGRGVEKLLAEANYPVAWVAENLAVGAGALDAFEGLLASPAHRASLVSHRAQRAGIGLVRQDRATWLTVVLAEVMPEATRIPGPSARMRDQGQLVSRAFDAIGEARARGGHRAPVRDPDLDALALSHARHLAHLDLLEDERARDTLIEAAARATDAYDASVDVAVTRRPEKLADTPSARAPECVRAGIGAARGESKRFGGPRLWMVLVCTGR